MVDNYSIDVPKLLEKFKGWIEKGEVQFLQEQKQREEVSHLVELLIKDFDDANTALNDAKTAFEKAQKEAQKKGEKKREKYDRGLSDFLDWHRCHELGEELWHKLASYALTDIDPAQKGTSNLFKFLKAATEFEDLLYGLERFYRDHTLHSLWVYLIGEYMLREPLKEIRASPNWYLFNDIERDAAKYGYSDDLVDESRRQHQKFCDEVNKKRDAIWCIIALCHDLGYSLEKLRHLNEKVWAVLRFFGVSDLRQVGYFLDVEHQYLVSQFLELMAMDLRIVPSDDYWELDELLDELEEKKKELDDGRESEEGPLTEPDYEQEKTKLQEEYERKREQKVLVECYRDDSTYWRLCRSLEKKDHGILSAFLIFKVLGIFADTSIRGPAGGWGLDDDEVADNVIRGDILFAIAQHQFSFAYLVNLASLADILVLADELEEFSRLGRQLQSRRYFDTAAEVAISFRAVDGGDIKPGWFQEGKWTQSSRIDVRVSYTSQHQKREEFLFFFARKAKKLCELYSLEQKPEPGQEKYCTINSIQISVKWTDPQTQEQEAWSFTLSSDPSKTEADLPKHNNGKEYEAKVYPMNCCEDELVVAVEDGEIPLWKWLGVENPEGLG